MQMRIIVASTDSTIENTNAQSLTMHSTVVAWQQCSIRMEFQWKWLVSITGFASIIAVSITLSSQ